MGTIMNDGFSIVDIFGGEEIISEIDFGETFDKELDLEEKRYFEN